MATQLMQKMAKWLHAGLERAILPEWRSAYNVAFGGENILFAVGGPLMTAWWLKTGYPALFEDGEAFPFHPAASGRRAPDFNGLFERVNAAPAVKFSVKPKAATGFRAVIDMFAKQSDTSFCVLAEYYDGTPTVILVQNNALIDVTDMMSVERADDLRVAAWYDAKLLAPLLHQLDDNDLSFAVRADLPLVVGRWGKQVAYLMPLAKSKRPTVAEHMRRRLSEIGIYI